MTNVEVWWSLQKVKPWKASGPDNIPGWVLSDCACQLSEVMTDIFNTLLPQAKVLTYFKTSTIIPIPKSSAVSGPNDYRPVALTTIVRQRFEQLVMAHIKTVRIQEEPFHCRCHFFCCSPGLCPPGEQGLICQAVVPEFQLGIQHNDPTDSHQ